MLNAIFYLLRTGCHWRLLPESFQGGARSITTSELGRTLVSRLVKGRKRHILMDTFGALIALSASGSPAQASCRALEDSSAKCAGDYRKGGLIVVADRGYAVLEPLAKFCDFRDFPKTQPLILRVLGTRVFWNSNFSAETKSWRHFPKTIPHFLKAMNTRSLVPICLTDLRHRENVSV